MDTIDWSEMGQIGKITYTAPTRLTTNQQLHSLLVTLDSLRQAAQVVEFKLQYQSGQDYLYRFKDAGGRVFKEILRLDNPADPLMDFTCDFWRRTEFAAHRPLRDLVIGLIVSYQVTKIDVTWA